jgi:4-hydroxybenzoate polyprenyltransferase
MGLLRAARVPEWWDKLATHALACALLAYSAGALSPEAAVPFAVSLAYAACFLAFAYSLNSVTDAREDALAGKRRDAGSARKLAAASGALSIAIPALTLNPSAALLGIAAFALAISYSMRPIRFKERAALGVLAPAVSQRPAPFLLFALLLPPAPAGEAAFLAAWLFLAGAYSILVHQVQDIGADSRAGVKTLAARIGRRRARALRDLSLSALFSWGLLAFAFFPEWPAYSAALSAASLAGAAKATLFNSAKENEGHG